LLNLRITTRINPNVRLRQNFLEDQILSMKVAALIVGVLFSVVSMPSCAFAHEIGIQREYSSANCVSGYLLVDGQAICYVLEKPWNDNAPLVSSIPAGHYSAFVRIDGLKGWRIELVDVPDRDHIQIHIGNTTADSIGCLLPGRLIASDFCQVYKSGEAMDLLRHSLSEFSFSTSDEEISVVVSDGGGLDSTRIF
jgi:hypothetical protein